MGLIHRFGSSLNQHSHFHVVFIDGVFEPDPERGVRLIEADDAEAVQTHVRRRILRTFVRHGLLDKDDRKEMEAWDHGGGFSLDTSVRIEAHDRQGLERLLRYCARPPFAAERLEEIDAQRLIHHLPKPGPDGRAQLIFSPLELIGSIPASVPPPRIAFAWGLPVCEYDQRLGSGPPRGCPTDRCRSRESRYYPSLFLPQNRLRHLPPGQSRCLEHLPVVRTGLFGALTVPPDGGDCA